MYFVGLVVINGLTFAGLLFIVTSGLTLSFGLMRVPNLNHGAFYLTGSYIGLTVVKTTGNWLLAVLSGGLVIGLVALVEDRFLLRRFREQKLVLTLLTLSIAIIMADVNLLIWGGNPQLLEIPRVLDFTIFIFGIAYPSYRIFILAIAIIISVVLWSFLKKTKLGITIRAGIDNSEMVAVLGVDIEKVFTCVFVLSGFLGGIAGVMGGAFSMIALGQDWNMLTLALVTLIIGGMGSFAGTIVGSLITGLVFSFASAYIPQLSNFFIFLPVAIILALWRRGLLGREL